MAERPSYGTRWPMKALARPIWNFHLSGNLGSPIAGQENLKTLGRAQNPPMEK
jgi:hypothetical protein